MTKEKEQKRIPGMSFVPIGKGADPSDGVYFLDFSSHFKACLKMAREEKEDQERKEREKLEEEEREKSLSSSRSESRTKKSKSSDVRKKLIIFFCETIFSTTFQSDRHWRNMRHARKIKTGHHDSSVSEDSRGSRKHPQDLDLNGSRSPREPGSRRGSIDRSSKPGSRAGSRAGSRRGSIEKLSSAGSLGLYVTENFSESK